MRKIILASQSPRRKQLLEWAEIPFIVIPAHTAEIIPANTSVEEVPVKIAQEKALVVKGRIAGNTEQTPGYNERYPILAADTIVVLDNEIIGKPENRMEAIEMLGKLSGKTHRVITGVAILCGDDEINFSDTTEVSFNEITTEQIEYYIDQYKPYDKAGGYAIQEWIGVIGIKSINGDFYNVMGLPVSRVLKALEVFETV